MATGKTRSKFAELAKDVHCALRSTDIRVTKDYTISVCLASHFGARARARGQRKWSVTFIKTLRQPGWMEGGNIIPNTFAGIGTPIKFETDDFAEARDKFNELERKAYAKARERLSMIRSPRK